MTGKVCKVCILDCTAPGLPLQSPTNYVATLFWATVVTVGSLWRRLVRPYRRPPLCFALLVDPHTNNRSKEALASFLLNMRSCCQDHAFTSPLRRHVASIDDVLSQDSIGQQILQGAFVSKNHNIAVETNFGRAASMRKTMRGMSERTHNMCAKHVLAEIHHNHKRARVNQERQSHFVLSAAHEVQHLQLRCLSMSQSFVFFLMPYWQFFDENRYHSSMNMGCES